MKGLDFMLAFTKGKRQQVKGKNPLTQGKVNKVIPAAKSFKEINDKQSENSKNPIIKQKNSQIEQQIKQKKPKLFAEIQKLQHQLNQTDQHIKQTEKKLDVDLFLKKQKQKRTQYAKDINKQFQIQKQKRQEKLYKKYRQKQTQSNPDQLGNNNLGQTKNLKSAFPFDLIKILENQKISISKSKTIVLGHDMKIQNISNDTNLSDYQSINKEQNQLMYELGSNGENKNESSNQQLVSIPIKKIAESMLNISTFPLDFSKPLLQPAQEYENIMSALTLMPQHLSAKLYTKTQINSNPFYLCKMFFNGLRKSVITSDLIVARQFLRCHVNMHSKMSDNRSFGPTIVQKCFRKVSSNFEYLQFRASNYAIYGVDLQVIQISNKNYLKQNVQPIIKFLMETGQIVAFMNDDGYNPAIYENRLYKLRQIKDSVQLSEQQLHGRKEKENKNKNKNKTKKQKDQQKRIEEENAKKRVKKVLYHLQNPYKGLVLDSKGLNKFQLLQLFEKFNKLILLRDYPKGWICKRINLEIFSLGAFSITNNQWTKNNQYHFTISKQMNMRVVMRKQYFSTAQSIIKPDNLKEQDLETNNLYGFLIFICKEGEEKIACMKTEWLRAKPKSTDSLEFPNVCLTFQKGNYIIIPYSNKVSKTHYQFFNLDFFIQKSDGIQFGKAIINQWKWTKDQSKKDQQKIIQSLQSREYIQRTKTEDIQINRIAPPGVYSQKMVPNLQKENLVIGKDLKLTDLLIPGKLTRFLVNPEVQVVRKSKSQGRKGNKIKQNAGNGAGNKITIRSKNEQIQSLQKQQALRIMLGYDLLEGQDIDRGLMRQIQQNTEDELDFQDYGLGYDGLLAIMQTLMTYPSLVKLNLANNQLDDTSIIFLCHYLDKGNRTQMKELNVRGNQFGKTGIKAITGLMTRYKNLNVLIDRIAI